MMDRVEGCVSEATVVWSRVLTMSNLWLLSSVLGRCYAEPGTDGYETKALNEPASPPASRIRPTSSFSNRAAVESGTPLDWNGRSPLSSLLNTKSVVLRSALSTLRNAGRTTHSPRRTHRC